MCRTEIQCWTTKKIVQFSQHENQRVITLDEQRQKKEISLNAQRQADEAILDEQSKLKENNIINLECKQHTQDTSSTSNEIFNELCRFNSSASFLNCMERLDNAKTDLSFFEILILLRSNLAIGSCKTHLYEFIHKCDASAIISGFKLVESILKYIRIQTQTGRLEIHLQRPEDRILQSRCFDEINLIAGSISSVTTGIFKIDNEDLLRLSLVISKLIDDIEQIFNNGSRTSYRPPEKRIRTSD